MAQSNVIVRLSLKDQELVKRGLESTGEAGQRALARIEAAGRAPSAGLKALGQASDELKGHLDGLAGQAGVAGTALRALGGTGLLVAAGLAAAVARAREVREHFAGIADAAARAGVATDLLQALRQTFIGNASSVQELNTVLEKLQQLLGEAESGSEKAQATLDRYGVTARETGPAFLQFAQHVAGLTSQTEKAAAITDVFGDRARGLAPAITASADAQAFMNKGLRDGTIASEGLVRKYGELNDQQNLLREQSQALASEGLVHIERAWTNISKATQDALGWALKYIAIQGDLYAAQNKFWERQFTTPKPPGSGEPGATGDWSAAGGSSSFRSAQDVGLDWRPEPALAAPAARPTPSGSAGRTPASAGRTPASAGRSAAAAREPDLDLKMGGFSTTTDTGLPLKDADAWATSVREASYEFRQMQAVGDAFYAGLDRITQKTEDAGVATSGFGDAWNQALTVGTQATADLANGLADVLLQGGKVQDVFEGIAQQLLKSTLSTSLQAAIGSPGGAGQAGTGLAGLFAGMFGPSSAHGNVFDRGELIPFACGGVVDRPTLFPMARGMGLMGEAGPEAVMPLERLPNGRLGVGAAGGSPQFNVIINNNAGAKVTTEERRNEQGGFDMVVMIDAVEQAMAQRMTRPGTTLNRAYRGAADPVRAR